MPKLNTPLHAVIQDRQGRTFADVVNDSQQPFDAVLDFSICGRRQRPMKVSGTHHEQIPTVEHPHGTKHSRQAVSAMAHLNMEHHGWKQTGKKISLWAFEHRWAHRRDRAEGRNHRLPSK
jgi:hypothetical protein